MVRPDLRVLVLGMVFVLAATRCTPVVAQQGEPTRLVLGDIILRDTAGAVFRMGTESMSGSPTGDFRRNIPITLQVEVASSADRPDAATSVAFVANAGRDSLPMLRLRFPSPLRAGTTTVRHELDVGRIPPGRYRIDVIVTDPTTGHVLQRGVILRLR